MHHLDVFVIIAAHAVEALQLGLVVVGAGVVSGVRIWSVLSLFLNNLIITFLLCLFLSDLFLKKLKKCDSHRKK